MGQKQVNINDNGVAMVVMDKQDYMARAKNLLEEPAYKPLLADPTNKNKAKLINILKTIKNESAMDDNMYPTEPCSSKFYRFPKIHKKTPPGP